MFGLDLLGLAKYPKVAKNNFPEGFALGVFSDTFGDSRPAVDGILDTGKCPRVRIHLMWKDAHSYTRSDFPSIVKEARKWLPVVAKHPRIEFVFSGACEHLLNAPDANELRNRVLEVFATNPKISYANTPMQGGADIQFAINERHGSKAQSRGNFENFSFDGSACVDSDVEKIKKEFRSAQTFFFWEPRFNGRWEDNDKTPRPDRKGWPDGKLIRSVIALSGACGDVSLPPKWLYKSHSENNGDGSSRAEKPVMISPLVVSDISLREGPRTVGILKYYGPYSGGGFRYYAKTWGYEIATQPVEVWAAGKRHGTINPAFRCGSFRE